MGIFWFLVGCIDNAEDIERVLHDSDLDFCERLKKHVNDLKKIYPIDELIDIEKKYIQDFYEDKNRSYWYNYLYSIKSMQPITMTIDKDTKTMLN